MASSRKPPVRRALGIEPPPISIFDIGAMVEGEDRYTSLLLQELATVIGFEPNRAQLAKLLAQNTPRKQFLPYFLGSGAPGTFHITHYAGCCSLYEPDPGMIDLFIDLDTGAGNNYHVVKTVPVQTQRLDDIAGLPPADFIKADIQGAELEMLKAGTRVLADTVVLEVEAEFVPLYSGQPLFCDLQVFLRAQGFMFHKFIDVGGRAFRPMQLGENPREPISQVLYADAIFVRDFVDLPRWSDAQLLKGAVILYEIYNSHDLVHRLLAEYDRRCGTSVAATFMQTLRSLPSIPTMYLTQKLQS